MKQVTLHFYSRDMGSIGVPIRGRNDVNGAHAGLCQAFKCCGWFAWWSHLHGWMGCCFSPCLSSRGWSLKTVIDPALLPEIALVNTYCPGIIFNSVSFYLQSAPFWIISHMTTFVNSLQSVKSGCVYWSFFLKSLFLDCFCFSHWNIKEHHQMRLKMEGGKVGGLRRKGKIRKG